MPLQSPAQEYSSAELCEISQSMEHVCHHTLIACWEESSASEGSVVSALDGYVSCVVVAPKPARWKDADQELLVLRQTLNRTDSLKQDSEWELAAYRPGLSQLTPSSLIALDMSRFTPESLCARPLCAP